MSADLLSLQSGFPPWRVLLREREAASQDRAVTGTACLAVMADRCGPNDDIGKSERGRLGLRDRARIATALRTEVSTLENAPERCRRPFSVALLMLEAELVTADDPAPTKRLPEYVADCLHGRPKENAARRARLHARMFRYRKLIEALLTFTEEDPDAVCDRIFAGTTFRGTETDIHEHRRIAAVLADACTSASKATTVLRARETLESVFRRTAAAKETVQKKGALTNWPNLDLNKPWEEALHGSAGYDSEMPDWTNPYWPAQHAKAKELFALPGMGSSGFIPLSLNWYDAVLSLPRVYLGCAVSLPDWLCLDELTSARAAGYVEEIDAASREGVETRSLDTGSREVMWRHGDDMLVTQFARRNRDPVTGKWRALEGEGHCWLVIYPSPSGKGLCPLLYWSQGESGVHVCVADEPAMPMLSEILVAADRPGKLSTLYERVVRLVADGGDWLEQEWARTAYDVLDNPVLRELLRREAGAPAMPPGIE